MVYNPDDIEKDFEDYPTYNGGCWNCGVQFKLSKNETNCDSCGELIRWNCNACHNTFDVIDKKTKNKLKECKLCGYFICPLCRTCLSTCKKYDWQKDILKILRKDIPIGQYPTLPERAKEITDFIIDQRISLDRKTCPIRKVPISYAKSRIKSLAAKFDGFRVKDEEDREAFLRRFDEITKKVIGTEFTINSIREKGSYGQEFRDAFNLGVCLGKFKIDKRKHEKTCDEYDVFIRCENGRCPNFAIKELVITHCEKCKKTFPRGTKVCDVCSPYSKGKNKGQPRKLSEKLNNKDTCQCYRGDFNGKA